MLSLNISAETISELKQKAFESLGITEPKQADLFKPASGVDKVEILRAQMAVDVEVETAPVIVNQAPKKVSKTKTKKVEEAAVVTASEKEETSIIDMGDVTKNIETKKELTASDCKAALSNLMATDGENGTELAAKVLGKFKARMISELKPQDYSAFISACGA